MEAASWQKATRGLCLCLGITVCLCLSVSIQSAWAAPGDPEKEQLIPEAKSVLHVEVTFDDAEPSIFTSKHGLDEECAGGYLAGEGDGISDQDGESAALCEKAERTKGDGYADGRGAGDFDKAPEEPSSGGKYSEQSIVDSEHDDIAFRNEYSDVAANQGDAPKADIPSGEAFPLLEGADTPLSPSVLKVDNASLLPDGIYAISADGSSLHVDVTGGGTSNGTEVVLWDADYSAKQAFRFTRMDDGSYVIQMIHSGKVLASSSFSADNGAKVVEWNDNGTTNMRWIVSMDAAGFVTISCKANGLVLDYAANSAYRGASLVLWEETGASKQRFWLIPTSIPDSSDRVLADGVYEIASAYDENYVVSVSGVGTSNGSQAVLWWNNNGCNQKFYVSYSQGYYSFSVIAGPLLSVSNFGSDSGTNVIQWEDNATANQRWALVSKGNGQFAIVAASSGSMLDFAANDAANGVSMVMWGETGSKKQYFTFKPTTAASNGYFAIVPTDSQGLAVSINGGSLVDGVQPILWSYAGTLDQKYQVIVNADGTCVLKSLQSGLILTAVPDEGSLIQTEQKTELLQNWMLNPLGDGAFGFVSGGSWCLQVSDALASSALVGVGKQSSTSYQAFRIVPVSLLEDGWYQVTSAAADNLKISLTYGSSARGLGLQVKDGNGRAYQKFYIQTSGFDTCQIKSLYSDQYVAAAGAWQANGTGVLQWVNNKTANLYWTTIPTFDGHVSFSVQSSGLYLDFAADVPRSGASLVVWESTGSNKQKFTLVATTPEYVLRDWQWALNQASGGFSTFNTDYVMSDGVYQRLVSAIRNFTSMGAGVGFLMMDLTTGQGVTYGIDDVYYGASTVKGPYVTSACKYGGLSPCNGLAHDAIVWSDNEAYGLLRSEFGNGCFARFCNELQTTYDRYSKWPYTTARELASLWTGMYDYFISDSDGSAATASLYMQSYMSSINRCMSGSATVYSKPGWMGGGSSTGPIYNDAGIVVVGDRPYVVSIVSSGNFGWPGQMDSLVRALDNVHSEMMGWV